MSKLNKQKNLGGVKTEAGKMVSKYNSVKHGILRETVTDNEKIDVRSIYNFYGGKASVERPP